MGSRKIRIGGDCPIEAGYCFVLAIKGVERDATIEPVRGGARHQCQSAIVAFDSLSVTAKLVQNITTVAMSFGEFRRIGNCIVETRQRIVSLAQRRQGTPEKNSGATMPRIAG